MYCGYFLPSCNYLFELANYLLSVSNLVTCSNISQSTDEVGSDGSVQPVPDKQSSIVGKNQNSELTMQEIINLCNIMSNNKQMDIKRFLSAIDMKLLYYKSGTYGHIFKALDANGDVKFVIKMMPYVKDNEYGSIRNLSRSENVEHLMSKLLNTICISQQHIIKYYTTFQTNIEVFTDTIARLVNTDNELGYDGYDKYKNFCQRYADNEFENVVSVTIYEWCDGDNFLDYVRKNYKNMTLKQWTVIFFQLLFTLATIQLKYPAFRHNSLKANDILLKTNIGSPTNYEYVMDNKLYTVPNIGFQIKISDFDFACIDGVINNNKVNSDWCGKLNISNKENKYYDIHYFFNTLTKPGFFTQFYEEGAVPKEIIDFVHRVVPEQYRNKSELVNIRGRILVNDEYTTPYKLITEDPLFEKYRFTI